MVAGPFKYELKGKGIQVLYSDHLTSTLYGWDPSPPLIRLNERHAIQGPCAKDRATPKFKSLKSAAIRKRTAVRIHRGA